jgi:hypothetical protein
VQLTRRGDRLTRSAGGAPDGDDGVIDDASSIFEVFIRKWTGEQVILHGASRSRAAELASSEARLRKRQVYVRNLRSGGTIAYRPDSTISLRRGLPPR